MKSDEGIPGPVQCPDIYKSTLPSSAHIAIMEIAAGEVFLLVHGANACQIFRARTEGYIAHAKCVFRHGGGGYVARDVFR